MYCKDVGVSIKYACLDVQTITLDYPEQTVEENRKKNEKNFSSQKGAGGLCQ
jgi:hypothetical protein